MEIPQKLLKKINFDFYDLKTYKDLMKLLSSNYKFKLFDEKNKISGIYLRHDIDVHPVIVEELLSIYSEYKIKANFFFLINSPNYNVFSNDFKLLVNKLKKKKHLVGMHICNDLKWSQRDIHQFQDYFEKNLGFNKAFSFHQPNKENIKMKMKNIVNVYDSRFFSDDKYISDSNKKNSFLSKLINFVNMKKKTFQVLVHPIWWNSNKNNLDKKIKKILSNQYNDYISSISKKLVIR